MRLFWEKHHPIFLGLLVALCYWLWAQAPLPKDLSGLLGTFINVSGIAIAFLTTIKTLLLSMEGNYVVKQLKAMKLYRTCFGYLMSAIHWAMLLALLSGLGFFVDWKTPVPWHQIAFAVWLFCLTVTVSTSYRIIGLFTKLIDVE